MKRYYKVVYECQFILAHGNHYVTRWQVIGMSEDRLREMLGNSDYVVIYAELLPNF